MMVVAVDIHVRWCQLLLLVRGSLLVSKELHHVINDTILILGVPQNVAQLRRILQASVF